MIVFCLIMFLFGWFANEFLQTEKATAAKTVEYKAVEAQKEVVTGQGLEKILNTYAKQGWKLNPWGPAGRYVIFER